jgi:hypothetical protein
MTGPNKRARRTREASRVFMAKKGEDAIYLQK